ncbi:Spc98 family protein [Lepidopterella palustris CBS 459.81]|uniref:Spindle pole body component n=1 Tax=Lepidopterella palustris CBS 459.81 TaxID=1314670 RepID=A0A8E2EED2_9PEZI|nr:Spc98 family protein [Lepidopterella palustris CBS 459.81]
MLHEILLSLSGHPSALFGSPRTSQDIKPDSFPLLSPPEAKLLSSIGRLSQLHQLTRDHASRISSSHASTICRAVATAITSSHLARFQQKVLDVESQILKRDSSTVGAYNIVPLAGVVGEFDEWTRLMEWLWGITNFMMPPDVKSDNLQRGMESSGLSSGAAIIDKLRQEAQTGYPDIEEAAIALGYVAEMAWLRQISTWILYGRLPTFGATDFCIQVTVDEARFGVNNSLVPKFVSQQTASSILFIGKSLNQTRILENTSNAPSTRSSRASELELLPVHLKYLSEVTAPISSARLSESVASIRLSLSRNMLQHLLPLPKIIEVLSLLQEFFLLGRGEFAVALITEADERVRSRHRMPGKASQSKASGQSLQSVLLKESEITAVLARAWSILSTVSGEEDQTDDALDLAMDLVHLVIHKSSSNRPATPGRAKESFDSLPKISNVVFNDVLLSIPTSLTMDIRPPLDLFITSSELDIYSSINSYLLAVRRAHLKLADLWRQSSIRREHPAPPGPQFSSTPSGKAILRARRQRADTRGRDMRKVWATCGAAIFFLSESGAYFEGEVVQESWKHFREWIIRPEQKPNSAGQAQSSASVGDRPSSAASRGFHSDSPAVNFRRSVAESERAPHDPETLASAHCRFLASLTYSLLLTDFAFTRCLREFVTHVDELVAFITRLQTIQQNLDLEEDGVVDAMANNAQEEKDVSRELDRARKRVDSDLKSLVARLREIDAERVGSGSLPVRSSLKAEEFESLRVGGIDRLLMKLDWGSSADDEDEDGDWDNS